MKHLPLNINTQFLIRLKFPFRIKIETIFRKVVLSTMINFFKKDKRKQDSNLAKEAAQLIQNFNAPVGLVQNGAHASAFVNQVSQYGAINSTFLSRKKLDVESTALEANKLLVDRFLKIYENHGIRTHQIPRFAAQFDLKLTDFSSYYSILGVLNEEFISWTSHSFGVDRTWLEGEPDWSGQVTERIYSYFDCYKSLHLFSQLFEKKQRRASAFCLYAFKNGELTRDTYDKSVVILVLKETIGEINRKSICRYKPISTRWMWDYYKTRYQVKAIFMLCQKLGIQVCGFDLPDSVSDPIAEGKVFPEPIINDCRQFTWYPEDFVDKPAKSVMAKESEELDKVLNYLSENGYTKFLDLLNGNPAW